MWRWMGKPHGLVRCLAALAGVQALSAFLVLHAEPPHRVRAQVNVVHDVELCGVSGFTLFQSFANYVTVLWLLCPNITVQDTRDTVNRRGLSMHTESFLR